MVISSYLWGCGNSQTGHRDPAESLLAQRQPIAMQGCRPAQGGEELRTTDINQDGHPEVCKYYLRSADPERPGQTRVSLIHQHLDVNWDGKIDIKRTFSIAGIATREEWDADYDGNIDEVRTFEEGMIVRSDRDLDNDGRMEVTRYYDQGKLERKESDTNQDGKTDRWEYFKGPKVERIGVDKNYDGTIDSWTKYSPEPSGS